MHPAAADGPLRAPPIWARAGEWIAARCHGARGHRLPWVALAFGFGVGAYFALPVEPSAVTVLAAVAASVLSLIAAYTLRAQLGFLPLLVFAVLSGLLMAQARTASVAGPVLDFRYYGAIEGRIVAIDRSASGAPRLTLDRVRLDRLAPDRTPRRVRISLQDTGGVTPRPGLRVMTTGHLLAPNGPTEPGGFDFQRHAWFLKLGAVGYTRIPLLQAEGERPTWGLAVARIRGFIGEGLRARLDGQIGQVAAAITTGDRAGLSDAVTADLRASNLAHLLAISGLHMGLLVGFVFWAVRGGLALIPSLALRHPTRAWAAAAALPFALAYLFLSGGTVATQRAFVMAAVMLGAILLGRRALSIRSVAIAAILVLLWRPESLTGPGFQMSFAATGALVLAFGALARARTGNWLRGWRGAVLSLFLSSLVAGLATGPIAALHFGRVGQYGVLANMLAVPMMGFAVMPLLFVGLLLWPLGLEGVPFRIAGWGIEWILLVAEKVANLPGAVSAVPAPGWYVLPVLGLAYGILGAARSWTMRAVGCSALIAAGGLWLASPRPDLLVSDDGRLVGILGAEGRWLNREKGAGFVARVWLENDGDMMDQFTAAQRTRPDLPSDAFVLHIARGKRDMPAAIEACRRDPGWLVMPHDPENPLPECNLLTPSTLRTTGAVSFSFGPDGSVTRQTARALQGQRPWTEAGGR